MKNLLKLSFLLILCLALAVPGFANYSNDSEQIFTDVGTDHYAFEAISTMKELGIINGYPDGSFKPQEIVTRVEFATMMVKTLNLYVFDGAKSSFSDMGSHAWAVPYVEAAKPYLTGYKTSSGINFKPDSPSVREDMAVALVKALEKEATNQVDLTDYADKDQVSSNLRNYVSAAINKKIMVGEEANGKKYFYPQRSLTRAEAAQLLMNVINEEKISFDDDGEKIVINDTSKDTTNESTGIYKVSNIGIKNNGNGKITLTWDKNDDTRLLGYKVVASKSNQNPMYPNDGYYKYITDRSQNYVTITVGDGYNNGDIGKFEAGVPYYFSITTLYKDKTVPGSTTNATFSKLDSSNTSTNENLTLKTQKTEDGLLLTWTKSTNTGFTGYKVVASKKDSTPVYPDNGYFVYITSKDQTSILIKNRDTYKNGDFDFFDDDEDYYFSITYLNKDGNKSTNTIKTSIK